MANKKITDLDRLDLDDLNDQDEIMISQDNITYKTTIGALRANISGNIDQRIKNIENGGVAAPAYSKSAYIFHNDDKKFYPNINKVNDNIIYKKVTNKNTNIDTITFTNNSNKGYMINVLYREKIYNKDYVFKNKIQNSSTRLSPSSTAKYTEKEFPVWSTKVIYKTKVALLGNKNSITFDIYPIFPSLQTSIYGVTKNNNQFLAELTDL